VMFIAVIVLIQVLGLWPDLIDFLVQSITGLQS